MSPIARALRDKLTARDAVEAMLRDSCSQYADSATPRGCLIVLAATTYTPNSTQIRDLLTELRDADGRQLHDRLYRAVADGDLSPSIALDALPPSS